MLGLVYEAEKPMRRSITVTRSSPTSSKVKEFLSRVIMTAFRRATRRGGKKGGSCWIIARSVTFEFSYLSTDSNDCVQHSVVSLIVSNNDDSFVALCFSALIVRPKESQEEKEELDNVNVKIQCSENIFINLKRMRVMRSSNNQLGIINDVGRED